MPRYELIEGSSKKFWEITIDGASFTTTYGRIGTDGQSTGKDFDSPEKARKEYDKLVAEKTKKGYQLVSGDAPAPAPAAPIASAAAPIAKAAKKAAAAELFDDEGEDEDEDAPKAKKPAAKAAAPVAAASSRSETPGARYFELVEGSSAKFWEITIDGAAVTTRYGRLGTDGQMTMKEYDSPDKARKEYEKLVAEKTRKGYGEK